jgi:hypothetical protein
LAASFVQINFHFDWLAVWYWPLSTPSGLFWRGGPFRTPQTFTADFHGRRNETRVAALPRLISPRRETMSYSQSRPVQTRFESYAVDWNAFVPAALVVGIACIVVALFA